MKRDSIKQSNKNTKAKLILKLLRNS